MGGHTVQTIVRQMTGAGAARVRCRGGNNRRLGIKDGSDIVDISTVDSLLPLLPLALIPLTVRAFGFYMKRCDADFYESLPYTRTQVLFSQSAALAVLSLGMLLVSSATSIITAIEDLEGCIFLVGDSLLLILAYFIASLIAIFATVIAVSITGNSFNAVLASYLILFTPATIKDQLSAFAERSPTLEGTSVLLKNEFNLLTYMPSEVPRLSAYIYSLVLAILLCFVALILFKRRRSEVATNFFANSLVGHILRICLTLNLGCSIVGVARRCALLEQEDFPFFRLRLRPSAHTPSKRSFQPYVYFSLYSYP